MTYNDRKNRRYMKMLNIKRYAKRNYMSTLNMNLYMTTTLNKIFPGVLWNQDGSCTWLN